MHTRQNKSNRAPFQRRRDVQLRRRDTNLRRDYKALAQICEAAPKKQQQMRPQQQCRCRFAPETESLSDAENLIDERATAICFRDTERKRAKCYAHCDLAHDNR